MRLVDLDEVINAIYSTDWYHLFNGKLSEGAEDENHALYKATDIYKAVGEVQQVDAEPVRHGKWIRDEFGTRCGSCGLYAYRDKFDDQPWESPCCPNCGARMDGEGEKDE